VASQTLDEFTRETRAGLEFVLQNQKTIDIQLDMNAPIIIIPEESVRISTQATDDAYCLSVSQIHGVTI
jgi:hypothetical protein